MSTRIFVNLPVRDLDRSKRFFTELGFAFDQKFSDETAACMSVTDDTFVMLLTEDKFGLFTPKVICNAAKFTEVLVCLSLDSRKKVDDLVRRAVSAGGTIYSKPRDYGFMYGHGFQDPDHHIWEVIYMEPCTIREG